MSKRPRDNTTSAAAASDARGGGWARWAQAGWAPSVGTPALTPGFKGASDLAAHLSRVEAAERALTASLDEEGRRVLAGAAQPGQGSRGAPGYRAQVATVVLRDWLAAEPCSVDPLLMRSVFSPPPSEMEVLCDDQRVEIHKPFDITSFNRRLTNEGIEELEHTFSALICYVPESVDLIAAGLTQYEAVHPGQASALKLEDVGRACASAVGASASPSTKATLALLTRLLGNTANAVISTSVHCAAFKRDTYSTFGRYFTCRDVMDQLVERLRRFMVPSDTYVDFSAGTNEFGALLAKATGMTRWLGLDIYPSRHNACRDHFRLRNWFDVKRLPAGAVIGLNPPFGSGGELASAFVERALAFRPRLLALVLPDRTRVVSNMVAASNAWKQRAREAAATRKRDDPFVTAAWDTLSAARREELLAVPGRPPDYLLVDASAEVVSGSSFYAPGTRGKGRRQGGGLGALGGGGASAHAGSTYDMSGDLPIPRKPAGGGVGVGAAAASSADDPPDSEESRGLSIRPEGDSSASWFVFARRDFIASPAMVVEAKWSKRFDVSHSFLEQHAKRLRARLEGTLLSDGCVTIMREFVG